MDKGPALMFAAWLVIMCAIVLAGCKTTSSSEAHMAANAAETLDATGHSETHVEEAPSKVTTVVEEYGVAPPEGIEPSSGPHRMRLPDPVGVGGAETNDLAPESHRGSYVSEHGPLVKRTVTVAEIGKKTTDTEADLAAKAREEARLKAEAEQKKSFDFLHSPFALLGGLVALAGVAFAAFKLLKPRILP